MQVSVEKPGSPSEILEHFGAKGMKWGVRKAVDKSLGTKTAGKKSSSKSKTSGDKKEARAKTHSATAINAQKAIDQIKASPPSKYGFIQKGRENHIRELEQHRDTHVKAAKDIRDGHMTDFQKHALIGAGVAATVLAAYGTYKFVDSGSARQLLTKGIEFRKNDLLSRKMSPEALMKEVVKPINPGYGELGTKMNCRRATFAYEMRRRGNDVEATKSLAGTGQTVAGMLNATHPDSHLGTGKLSMLTTGVKEARSPNETGPLTLALKLAGGMGKEEIDLGPRSTKTLSGRVAQIGRSSIEKSQSFFDIMAEHPEGARGELGVTWKTGGAHSMAWEIIGGKAHIFDTQSGVYYGSPEQFHSIAGSVSKAGITRLDDMDLNTNFLKKWVTNVK